jgi:hypothetical protein
MSEGRTPVEKLRTEPGCEDPDAFYAALIRRVDEAASEREALAFLTRLTLALANHIGSQNVLEEALIVAGSPLVRAQVPK